MANSLGESSSRPPLSAITREEVLLSSPSCSPKLLLSLVGDSNPPSERGSLPMGLGECAVEDSSDSGWGESDPRNFSGALCMKKESSVIAWTPHSYPCLQYSEPTTKVEVQSASCWSCLIWCCNNTNNSQTMLKRCSYFTTSCNHQQERHKHTLVVVLLSLPHIQACPPRMR